MSSRNIGASLLSRRAWRAVARSMQKRSRMLIVSLLVLTSCMTILGINPFSQHAKAQASPRVTVAAIDPSLVAGRGAQLGIVGQEAENATTNGTILPFDTSAYTLSGEASGRQAVQLTPGQYVAFTLTQRANAVTIRYAIPDAPIGEWTQAAAFDSAAACEEGKRATLAVADRDYAREYERNSVDQGPAKQRRDHERPSEEPRAHATFTVALTRPFSPRSSLHSTSISPLSDATVKKAT